MRRLKAIADLGSTHTAGTTTEFRVPTSGGGADTHGDDDGGDAPARPSQVVGGGGLGKAEHQSLTPA